MEEAYGFGVITGFQGPFPYKPITLQGRCRIRFVSDLLNENGSWNIVLLQEFFLLADITEIMKIRASRGWRKTRWLGVLENTELSQLGALTNLVLTKHTEAQQLVRVLIRMVEGFAGDLSGQLMYPQQFRILLGGWLQIICPHGGTNTIGALN